MHVAPGMELGLQSMCCGSKPRQSSDNCGIDIPDLHFRPAHHLIQFEAFNNTVTSAVPFTLAWPLSSLDLARIDWASDSPCRTWRKSLTCSSVMETYLYPPKLQVEHISSWRDPLTITMAFWSPRSILLMWCSLTIVNTFCYNWLSLRDFFSSHLYHSTYVSARPMSVSRGPVCILFGSSLFLLRALPSGRPYPCSPSALRFLSGVGSHLWSHCYIHSLFVIPMDRSISSRRFSRIASCSSWLTLVLLYSIEFHDDAYSSTYTDCRCISSLRLFYAIQGILSRPSLALNLQSLSVSTSDFKSLSLA